MGVQGHGTRHEIRDNLRQTESLLSRGFNSLAWSFVFLAMILSETSQVIWMCGYHTGHPNPQSSVAAALRAVQEWGSQGLLK